MARRGARGHLPGLRAPRVGDPRARGAGRRHDGRGRKPCHGRRGADPRHHHGRSRPRRRGWLRRGPGRATGGDRLPTGAHRGRRPGAAAVRPVRRVRPSRVERAGRGARRPHAGAVDEPGRAGDAGAHAGRGVRDLGPLVPGAPRVGDVPQPPGGRRGRRRGVAALARAAPAEPARAPSRPRALHHVAGVRRRGERGDLALGGEPPLRRLGCAGGAPSPPGRRGSDGVPEDPVHGPPRPVPLPEPRHRGDRRRSRRPLLVGHGAHRRPRRSRPDARPERDLRAAGLRVVPHRAAGGAVHRPPRRRRGALSSRGSAGRPSSARRRSPDRLRPRALLLRSRGRGAGRRLVRRRRR